MILENFNQLSDNQAFIELEKCCGSHKWAKAMAKARPFLNQQSLHSHSDDFWHQCTDSDYLEAFTHHPQIGDIDSLKKKFVSTANWASKEQQAANEASDEVLTQLKKGNESYLKKFGFIFIVCATGKTATQMLDLLNERLVNNKQHELITATAEQNKITHLRLNKLLESTLGEK